MKRPKRWWLTFLWTFPTDIVVWVAVLSVRILFGKRMFWLDGLWVELRENSMPDQAWGKRWNGITLGHGGILSAGRGSGPDPNTSTEEHELVHVEQFEERMLTGFIVALVCAAAILAEGCAEAALATSLTIWVLAWPLGYASSVAQAYLRGEDPYRGSHLEEAAYNAADDDLE